MLFYVNEAHESVAKDRSKRLKKKNLYNVVLPVFQVHILFQPAQDIKL